MKNAENAGNSGCLQRDSMECKEYAGAQSAVQPETGETGAKLTSDYIARAVYRTVRTVR